MIVAVVGMSGVGKSVAVRWLCDRLDAPSVYFGGLVVDEAATRGISGPAGEELVRNELREQHGMAAIAHLARPRIEAALEASAHVVIDGVYSHAEDELLRAEFGAAYCTVAVHSARALRYERLSGRPVRPLTPAEVDRRDADETARLDKARPIALADHHVVNDGTVDELHAALETVVGRLDLVATEPTP